MSEQETDRLPSTWSISSQPVMVMGLNGTELIIVIVSGFAAMFAGSILGSIVLGRAHQGLLVGSAAGLIVSVVMKMLIQVFKRQKPEGYYKQLLYRVGRDWMGAGGVIGHQGRWDALRHWPR